MGIVADILREVPLPRMARVRQNFPAEAVADVAAALRDELRRPAINGRLRPGMRIAVAVGSRGVAQIPRIVRTVVEELKLAGTEPFLVPAMGSHGGATAQGQLDLLAGLGVTEASAGCPIVSSMDVVELGRLPSGLPILMDRHALQADGIVVINRIKPHTAFSGEYESGLVKMITIGLGKQKGADSCHAFGFGHMARNIVDMARIKLQKAPFLFGVATVENAYDQVARIVAIPPKRSWQRNPNYCCSPNKTCPAFCFPHWMFW